MKRYVLLPVLLVLMLVPGWLSAATVGRITGVVTDASTKEPLVGISVQIIGTNMGAMTDQNGRYNIQNVPVGAYTLRFSSVGYATTELSNVEVSADLVSYANSGLSSQATDLGKTITVQAETPLVVKDRTSQVNIVKRDQILALPTRGFEQVVGIQNGVVHVQPNPTNRIRGARESTLGGELNIRGGRPSEVAYYVDGFSQQDPLSGNSTANINNNAIQEVSVLSGGFPAEYGNVASGIVNTITNSGSDVYRGNFEAVTDNVTTRNFDQNFYSGDVSGPIPGVKKGFFFASGERRWLGDRQPSSFTRNVLPNSPDALPNNWLSGWSWQGKIDYNITQQMKVQFSTNGSDDKWREYRHEYLLDAAHMPYYHDQNLGLNGRLTHTLNSKTYYNLSASWFKTARFRGDGVYRENLWAYGRPNGNPRLDPTSLFWNPDDPSTAPEESTYTVDGVRRSFVTGGDEGSVWDDYLKRDSRYIGLKGDINSELSDVHTIRAGFEFQRHTLRFYQHLFPTLTADGLGKGFQDANRYGYDVYGNPSDNEGFENETKHPVNAAAYAQDRIEWRGLIINAGLRFDYFNYKQKRLKSLTNPFDPNNEGASNPKSVILDESDFEASKSFTRLSPRLGIGFPVSDKTQLHLNYGKFYQRPDLIRLYVGYDFFEYKVRTGGYFFPIGNPNLEPERVTQYEIGFSHQLGENTSLDVNAFYKDMLGLVQVYNQSATPRSYSLYRNSDYGTSKGLEFALHMRRTNNIELDFKYTLAYAIGTGSYANTQQNIAWTNAQVPKQAAALDYDQRHNLIGNVDYRLGRQQGPRFGDIFPLENFGINIVAQIGSGLPYSPQNVYDEATLAAVTPVPSAARNSAYGPWTINIDLKAEKSFNLKSYKITPYVWVKNVLNRDNVTYVYEGTGRPNTTGWIDTPEGRAFQSRFADADPVTGMTGAQEYRLKEQNPMNYSNPRMFLFGVRFSF